MIDLLQIVESEDVIKNDYIRGTCRWMCAFSCTPQLLRSHPDPSESRMRLYTSNRRRDFRRERRHTERERERQTDRQTETERERERERETERARERQRETERG